MGIVIMSFIIHVVFVDPVQPLSVCFYEVCQISPLVIKILKSIQTFKPKRAVIGQAAVTWCSAVSRCAVPRASAEWSLSANSFSSGSIWILQHSLTITGDPFFFLFPRIILHHGRQKEPYQVLQPPAVDLYLFSSFWARYFDAFPSHGERFSLFSVGMPQLARIVQSLWRLLAPYNPVT